ncbi:HlyD family efflux transporter periplasmic adaptor subunit [Marinisporobacter balticus]|uniref:Putative membrane fusion protein n=1 Tax=Marinisporobacter balticus TaxID=2018667 RepID=A0A4R2L4Q8_9FIRM|nr:HlyD family efflux transporter periplasmic adaptor subunit [Marinisporobacter balticus]TCO78959.1 putative membrane fusion protein [Marinisporobacter balticus]
MKKKLRKKSKKNKRFRYFILGVILFYLGIKFLPMLISFSKETSIAEYGNIQVVDKLNCYIIREEKKVNSNVEGDIKYFAQEGEKIEKGYKIAEIEKSIVDDETRKKLEIINQRIESINENENNLFQSDIKKIDEEINKIINNIKEYKEKGNLLQISKLKRELSNKLEKKRIITGDKSFAGKNLEALKLEQEQLAGKINNAINIIKSPQSGIISYNIDGYENILTPKNMATIELEKLKKIDSKITNLSAEKVINQQNLFKIVDNNLWYMISWVDDDTLERYKVGRSVAFQFPQREITGSIYKIVENEKNNMVIFQLDQYVENFFNLRNIELNVISVNYEGLKIYRDSVIEKDGKNGVYVLDINRYVNFKRIKIIGYDDEYAIIQSNVFYEKDGEDMKTISTVKLYDEIVRNGARVKEGQMIY